MLESQKVNDLTTLFSQLVEVGVADALKNMGISPTSKPAISSPPAALLLSERDEAVNKISRIFTNNGIDPESGMGLDFNTMVNVVREQEAGLIKDYRVKAKDAAASPDIMLIMPRVVSQIIREPIQYTEQLAPLLRRIRVRGGEINITYPAVGAMGGQRLDMPEGGEYPEGTLDMAGLTNVKIGKSGIAVRWTEEMRRYSQFDFMEMLLRGAARALVRWKDKKIADHILGLGTTAFDNDDNTIASTTGRTVNGDFNGSLASDDIFTAYADMINDGFTPNALLVHPMAWLIFARDPQLRHLAWWNGGAYWGTPQGNLPYAGKFETNTMGTKGAWNQTLGLGGQSAIAGQYHPMFKSFPVPLQIVVSPTMPFTAATGVTPAKTSMVLCDANELGVMFVDEEPTSDQWDDPSRDIYKVKIRERYAIGILNDGQAIRSLKNVRITPSYDYYERMRWTQSGTLPSGGFVV